MGPKSGDFGQRSKIYDSYWEIFKANISLAMPAILKTSGVVAEATLSKITLSASPSFLLKIRTDWLSKLKYEYNFSDVFQPQGLNPSSVSLSLKEEMSNCFSSALPLNMKEDILNNILRSSSSTPVKKVISYGDELYKLVPKGKGYNKSSFYISKQEFNILKNTREIEQKLGLPLNSHAIEYDIYKATANQNVVVYESTIAKTKQGKYTTTGGAKQTFLLDDSKWTITLENKTLIPFK